MANKYCNLDGTKKIKEDYTKINDGFASVEADRAVHIGGSADKHAAQHITYSGDQTGANVKDAIDNCKKDINNISMTGSDHDALVTAALVDEEGTDFGAGGEATYLDGRLKKWEQKHIAHEADYTQYKDDNALIIPVVGDGVADDTAIVKSVLENAVARHSYKFPPNKIIKITSPIVITEAIKLDLNGSIINSYVQPNEYTITCQGSAEVPHSVIANTSFTSIQVSLADVTNYSPGDYIKISTDENYFVAASRDYKKGEIIRIAGVNYGTGVITPMGKGTDFTYLAAQNTKITKLNMLPYFKIYGGQITGEGYASDQIAIKTEFVKHVKAKDLFVDNFLSGLSIVTAYSGEVSGCYFKDMDDPDTGYGVVIGGASKNVNVHDNTFEKCRHGITTGGYDGVCMGLVFHHNMCIDCTINSAISTHGNAKDVEIHGNIIRNSHIGISVYSPYSNIHDNIIVGAVSKGIYGVEAGGFNVTVKDNMIRNVTGAAVSFDGWDTTGITNEYVHVDNNEMYHCDAAITALSAKPLLISANGNKCYSMGYHCIKLGDGEHLECKGNMIFGDVRSTYYAIEIIGTTSPSAETAIYGTTAVVENNHVGKFNRGIKVDNIGTLKLNGNMLKGDPAYKYTLTNVTNFEGGDILRSPDGTLYKLSVANGGALTAVTV